jgi:succinate dehydrogenase / fumarate reductase cytochrome b subunit
LAYGIWNFCIRWGITISESAQVKVQKFSLVFFVAVTLIGWCAMVGFFIHPKTTEAAVMKDTAQSTL